MSKNEGIKELYALLKNKIEKPISLFNELIDKDKHTDDDTSEIYKALSSEGLVRKKG